MPSFFSKIRGKDGEGKTKNKKGIDDSTLQLSSRPRWDDAYIRTSIEPEEAQDLIRRCTSELKARALNHPFLLLPFRPTSDPSAVRTFVRHFFNGDQNLEGEALAQELRMIEPMVLSGVLKWCWSRLPGGIVGWDAYELFKVGESDSNMARDSFSTFIPLSVENQAKSQIIFDYFDLLSAIAAHGKVNGFGGRKLSRMAAWWAFEHKDIGAGFDGGYKSWLRAADATSHLFFAYLRSLSPSQARAGISMLPMSLQKLLQETEYPPQLPSLMQSTTHRVVMIVETVSPTPFSLLRRANHFQYRESDRALHEYSEYEDPVEALTEECQRVLKAISLANQSQVSSSKHSTGLRDASWSRFEDIGFSGGLEDEEDDETNVNNRAREFARGGLRSTPASGNGNMGRPTTPSWADFLSSGFVDDGNNGTRNFLLPPDKVLPPIDTSARQRSSQSHRPRLESDRNLEPGELASITPFDLDDSFWWVWMSSLAPEETAERKSAFGRCAVIETVIRSGRWLVMEEVIKGAAAEPNEGAYLAEKKGFFSWTRRSKTVSRRNKTLGKGDGAKTDPAIGSNASKASIGPDQQAKIQAAAQQLHAKETREKELAASALPTRRGRTDAELLGDKTNSVMTLQPAVMSAASPAMKWASKYDKDAIRDAYLANNNLGKGGEPNGQPSANDSTAQPYDKPSIHDKPLPSPIPVVQEVEPENEWPRAPERPIEPASPLPPSDRMTAAGRNSPLPPVPKEHDEAMESRENMMSPEPEAGGKAHKKLHKDEKKPGGGGLRKLFGRKNRQSKLPDNAAGDVNAMLAQEDAQRAASASPMPPASPAPYEQPAPLAHTPAPAPQTPVERERTPSPPESIIESMEPTFEPPMRHENVSRVDTVDAAEAQEAFSRFDQGPLSDQPAFAPGDDLTEDEDDATPPPIARRSPAAPLQRPALDDSTEESSVPPAIDRWAQIRKNAAERAAARQVEESTPPPVSRQTDDNDDDTSGEETIESRVARIKARVAELTGNMEGTNAPGQLPYRQPPPLRR